jgi:hypothetical protein
MENLDKAMFCEKCGIRLVLPTIETQPQILNAGQGKILGIVPRVALIPLLGLVIGAFAFLFYIIGLISAVRSMSNPDIDPFNSDWASGPEALFVLAAVLGVTAAAVFWDGVIRMVLRSD